MRYYETSLSLSLGMTQSAQWTRGVAWQVRPTTVYTPSFAQQDVDFAESVWKDMIFDWQLLEPYQQVQFAQRDTYALKKVSCAILLHVAIC